MLQLLIFAGLLISVVALIAIAFVLDHWLQRIMLQINNSAIVIRSELAESNKLTRQRLGLERKPRESPNPGSLNPKAPNQGQAVGPTNLMTRAAAQTSPSNPNDAKSSL